MFPDTTTVYGDTDGVISFSRDQVIQSVCRYERSGKETLSIEPLELYINSRSRRRDFSFRKNEMYGTYFNYTGFMLDAIHTNGCCVPRYMFELLNNKLETNPRKKIARLTMKNVIDDLVTLKEDEGCCIAQVADFCKEIKIDVYALRSIFEISSYFFGPRPWHIEIRHRVKKASTINLFGFETLKLKIRRLKLWKPTVDYKHKLFETHKDEIPNNNLPRLVFMCANNHMYPVIDEERRETIFKTSSEIGGKINKYREKQKFKNKMKHGT